MNKGLNKTKRVSPRITGQRVFQREGIANVKTSRWKFQYSRIIKKISRIGIYFAKEEVENEKEKIDMGQI